LRKTGIVFLVVLAGIIIAIIFIFSDKWLERRMESLGSRMTGAKVEYNGVDFSLIGLRMHWNHLQVTDPDNTWKNLFETGASTFDLALEPLLKKKFIIESFEVQGIRLNTDRTIDGSLPKRETPPPKEKPKVVKVFEENLEKEKSQIPLFDVKQLTRKIDVESIWESVTLESPGNIESLLDDYKQKYSEWENRLLDLPGEKDIREIQQQIESIQIKKIKSVKELKAALSTLEDVYNRVDSYGKSIRQMKKDFEKDTADISEIDNLIAEWIKDDYHAVLELAKLPDLSVKNIAKILFGERIIAKIEKAVAITGKVRFYTGKIRAVVPKKERPPRFKGQDIQFVEEKQLPGFWIKKIELSGVTGDEIQIAGNIQDIVSNQKMIGTPTTFAVQGTRKDNAGVVLEGTFDYREEEPKELFSLDFHHLPLRNISLTDFPLLPREIRSGNAAIAASLNFTGADFKSKIAFTGNDIQFDFSEKPSDLTAYLWEVSKSLAQAITEVHFTAELKQTAGELSFSITSNLDNLIAGRIEEILSDEIKKAREALKKMVNEEVNKYTQKLERFIDDKERELRAEIEKADDAVQSQLDEVNKKRNQIENQIESEKSRLQKMLEEEVRKQKEQLEEEARKQKEKLEQEIQKEKEKAEEKVEEEVKKKIKKFF